MSLPLPRLLSVDVETDGDPNEYALQPWRVRQRKAFCSTVAWTKRDGDGLLQTKGVILQQGAAIDYDKTKDILAGILTRAIEHKYRVVGWNMTFDIGWFLAYGLGDLVARLEWLDAMRLWRHLSVLPTFQGKQSFSLDAANKAFEKAYVDYKVEGKDLYFNRDPAARKRLLAYNRSDTEATLLHCERFWHQLTEQQQKAALIEASCLPIVADANITGLRVDTHAREVLSNTLSIVGHQVAEALAPHGVTEQIIRSPARTATLLFKKWELPIIKYTVNAKTGEETDTPSTDVEVLHELALEDERVYKLGLWREALNLRSKFMGGLMKSTEYNGEGDRTYPQATVFATYTSRMAYSSKQGRGKAERPIGFAVHQMKNDPRFRDCIIAEEDCDIVEFDAAGQEFRWMAIKAEDETMLELCMPGGDPHSFMAAAIHGEDYAELRELNKQGDAAAKKKRKLGKVANLSLQYRTSKKKLRIVARVKNNLPMTIEEAGHIRATYLQQYPGVPQYWKDQIQLGKRLGYAETMAGRRVAVEGDWTGDYKWAMESTMINLPIQGTGGEQKYLALRVLRNILPEYGARYFLDLHDGIYFMVPKRFTKSFVARARHILDNLPYRQAWGFASPIPLPWDCKTGTAWGSLKEVDWGL